MVCAVSCGGSTGVFLTVTPPQGTDHLEVVVAPSPCVLESGDRCAPGISWATGLMPPMDSTIFSLGSDTRNIVAIPHGASTLQLKLEPASGEAPPDRLAFVAFDASDQPLGVSVLRDPPISGAGTSEIP